MVLIFFRTTQHLIEVVNHDFDLQNEAKAILDNDNEIEIRLKLNKKAELVLGEKFFAYAEVWESETKPIAWISGMSVIKKKIQKLMIFIFHFI